MLKFNKIRKQASNTAFKKFSKIYKFSSQSRFMEERFKAKISDPLSIKSTSYQILALDVFELIRSWLNQKNDHQISSLIETYNEHKNINLFLDYKIKLKTDFKKLNEKHSQDLNTFNFNNEDSIFFKSLALVDMFIENTDPYRFKKYTYIVKKYEKSSPYSPFYRYDVTSPKIKKLFPKATNALEEVFFNRYHLLIIEIILNELDENKEQQKPINDSKFCEKSKFRYLFFEKEIFEIVNEYLDIYAKGNQNQSFFNKLRYILINSKYKGKKLIKNRKSDATLYKDEISKKYNFNKFKLETSNIAKDYIETKNELEKISKNKELKIKFLQ